MHRTFLRFLSALGLSALLGLAGLGAVHAQEDNRSAKPAQPQSRPFPRAQESRESSHNSLADSVRRAQRERGVRVLSAERVPFDGRDINRIKVIDDRGRVRYMDDAGSSRRRSSFRSDEQAPPPSSAQPPARGDNPSHP